MLHLKLELADLTKPAESHWLMGTGPYLARLKSAGRVFEQVWNRKDLFLPSNRGPLAGHPDPLLTLPSSPIPPQQSMAAPTTEQGASGSELSRPTGASTNAPPAGTPQSPRHQSVHSITANAATKNLTQKAHFKTFCKTGNTKKWKRHACGGA